MSPPSYHNPSRVILIRRCQPEQIWWIMLPLAFLILMWRVCRALWRSSSTERDKRPLLSIRFLFGTQTPAFAVHCLWQLSLMMVSTWCLLKISDIISVISYHWYGIIYLAFCTLLALVGQSQKIFTTLTARCELVIRFGHKIMNFRSAISKISNRSIWSDLSNKYLRIQQNWIIQIVRNIWRTLMIWYHNDYVLTQS